jgi:hypothetical protein
MGKSEGSDIGLKVDQVLDQIAETQAAEMLDLVNSDRTVQQEAFFLHVGRVKYLRDLLDQHAVELKERQNKIRFVHGIMQEINNLMDEKGGLDISKNPDMQNRLKIAKEMGINILAEKTKFSPHECNRLLDNLNFSVADWEMENNTHLKKIQNLYTESEQSILIVKNTMSSIDRPLRAMISGIKGS